MPEPFRDVKGNGREGPGGPQDPKLMSRRASPPRQPAPRGTSRHFLRGLARAFAGAIVFGLPLLMTMEMWWLGFHADRGRMALLFILSFPLLVGLSHYSGFEPTFGWVDDVVDTFVACAVGFVSSGVILLLFGLIEPGMAAGEVLGKIGLQTLPASIGALLAAGQFATREEREADQKRFRKYQGELFLMMVGAIFLALSMAPTDEMVLIAYMMTPAQALGLIALSLGVMHAFVHAVESSGKAYVPAGTSFWSVLLRITIPGYVIALLTSAIILWAFERTDSSGSATLMGSVIVLGFPAAVGAGAARLII